jgi:predicted dehydrogenase
MNSHMDRRTFLANSAVAAASASFVKAASANDTVRVASVGLHGRGKSHIDAFTKLPNVELVALCDVDEAVLAAGAKQAESKGAKSPVLYKDLRKLLEDKSIDAISIATPNHQHTLQAIWAMQAGKDVYVEKPCSHDMWEAQQIVAAARKYNKIVQMGSQSRSDMALIEAVENMRNGVIGDLYMARGLCYKWRNTIGKAKEAPVPAGVDYDLWVGPAPMKPFTANRFHYNWHWQWEYGNGDLGNQGIHEVDVMRWGLGVKYPTKVSAIGGHFMFDDDQETPNTLTVAYEFEEAGKPKKMATFEVRHWMTHHEADIQNFDKSVKSNTVGNIFYGSNGYLAIDGYDRYNSVIGKDQTPGPSKQAGGDHFANFITAVRSRNRGELTAEIEEGAISTTLVHLANISYRLGRTLDFDAATYSVKNDKQANAMFRREYRAPFTVPQMV